MKSEYQIYNEIKELLGDYRTRSIEVMDGLYHNQYDVIKMCEFYANSRYLFGNKDELQRDKPFYNIVNYRVTIAKTATDLDVKDIQIGSDDPEHYVHSMLLQKESYEWMKRTNFSRTLNEVGLARPKYGGVLVKRTIDDGELKIDVVDWRNVTTDQVDTTGGAIVETHYLTPVELMRKREVWDLSNLPEIIQAQAKNDAGSKRFSTYQEQTEDHNSDRIKVLEVTGQFPKSKYAQFMDEEYSDDDDYEFTLQHYFMADVAGVCFPLFAEELKPDDFPYKYLPWETMPGRGLGRGVIEDSAEAQVWTNDAIINEKNAMDLAGKVVLTTTSKQVGSNILEIDNGRIFELELNTELQALNLEPSAIGEFDHQIQRWQSQANDATSSYDANSGKQPPADTPYSQTALLNQVAAKPFDYRREEAGIFWSEVWEDWVIPWHVKKLYKSHILASDFTDDELEVIDNAFATAEVNKKVKEAILAHKIVTLEQYKDAIQMFRSTMKGNRRFLEVPDGFFDNVKAKVTVMTTGEQKNKAAILQSLSTILGDVMKTYNPQDQSFAILNNPVMARIFGTILELSGAGISPASLGIGKPQAPSQGAPAMGGQAPQQGPQGIGTGPAAGAMPLAAPSPIQTVAPATPQAV